MGVSISALQLRMMSQISNAVEITVLPPYVPSDEERAWPAAYAKNVQELFCKTLGVPAVDQVCCCCMTHLTARELAMHG